MGLVWHHFLSVNACKLILELVRSLCKKNQEACEGVNLTRSPFEELTASLDVNKVEIWQRAADNAASQRGDALDIYTLKMEKGW